MPEDVWYYAEGNQKRGPVKPEAIPDLIRSGTIQADTLVWTAGMDNWAAARDTIPSELHPPETDDGSGPPPMRPSSPHPQTIQESVRAVFSRYATFQGRARRPEYWWFALFSLLVSIALMVVDVIIFGSSEVSVLNPIWSLFVLVPTLAVGARRLHDTGRSGWWLLIGLIPIIGTIILIIWFATKGDEGPNEYGPA